MLVDAIYCYVLENKSVFGGMHDLLETYPNKKIILTGASGKRFKEYGLDRMPYEVFTLEHNPDKSDPEYYKIMLEHYGLDKDDVVYIEHNKDAVKSAELVGIKTYYYDPDKRDLGKLESFLSGNL